MADTGTRCRSTLSPEFRPARSPIHLVALSSAVPHPPDPPDDPAFPSDFLALECNPCFGLNVGHNEGVVDTDDVRRETDATVRAAWQRLNDGLRNAVRFGRLLYRVRVNEPVSTDHVALWAETRGYIERQDGDRSAPLLDHIGKVVGLLAREGEPGRPSPPITAIDVLQFEQVMRSVIAMVEVAAGAMEEEWRERGNAVE